MNTKEFLCTVTKILSRFQCILKPIAFPSLQFHVCFLTPNLALIKYSKVHLKKAVCVHFLLSIVNIFVEGQVVLTLKQWGLRYLSIGTINTGSFSKVDSFLIAQVSARLTHVINIQQSLLFVPPFSSMMMVTPSMRNKIVYKATRVHFQLLLIGCFVDLVKL